MSPAPDRPFIPSSGIRPASVGHGVTSFHLTRPFVHGAEAVAPAGSPPDIASTPVAFAPADQRRPDTAVVDSLPFISQFLDDSRQPPDSRESEDEAFDYSADRRNNPDELPPVEHFTDPLPSVESFAPASGEGFFRNETDVSVASVVTANETESGARAGDESDWVDTGWQEFDWSGAAALGDASDPDASEEWSRTDWGSVGAPAHEFRETAAQAIANALDQIAQRIRKGEIIVPPPDLVNDPAAIAATLAALLGVRR